MILRLPSMGAGSPHTLDPCTLQLLVVKSRKIPWVCAHSRCKLPHCTALLSVYTYMALHYTQCNYDNNGRWLTFVGYPRLPLAKPTGACFFLRMWYLLKVK